MGIIAMIIQKFTTALLLSASIIYFCAADCMISKPQIISSNSIEKRLTGSREIDNYQSKGQVNSGINRSVCGITIILDNIKEGVLSHYTGMLPQNQTMYRRV